MSDYICTETVAQILMYLPAKSLLRFRCVCKEWKQLIDSSSFVQQHLSLRNQNHRFLARYEATYRRSPDFIVIDPLNLPMVTALTSPSDAQDCYLMATHHGVVCLLDDHNSSFLLWNPSIRKLSRRIPLPTTAVLEWDHPAATRVWSFGFWISPSTKEFKILILSRMLHDNIVHVLYTSVRNDWRLFPKPGKKWLTSSRSGSRLGMPVMIQDVAYWTGFDMLPRRPILSFDFILERIELIETPPVQNRYNIYYSTAFLWQGDLAIYCHGGFIRDEEDLFCRYNMYERKESCWVMNTLAGFDVPFTACAIYWVLAEQGKIRALVLSDDGRIVLYDSVAGITYLTDELNEILRVRPSVSVVNGFVESLLLP